MRRVTSCAATIDIGSCKMLLRIGCGSPAFGDYQELRVIIAEREDHFARGLTEHLIEYALGRPFGFTDADLANDVVSSAKSRQFAVSEFIHSLVQSKAFRTK